MTAVTPDWLVDTLWLVLCSFLVLFMQAGFLCVEAGLTRRKNNINVAIKNIADLGLSIILFWAIGYTLMFSPSGQTLQSLFPNFDTVDTRTVAFFLFQATFCSTAVTILSGAVAERMTFRGYLLIATLVSGLIYPIFGHWTWNGLNQGQLNGWLGQRGFVDFAGSTVVHSVGGWAALATVLIIGPRLGRFSAKRASHHIVSSNAPLALLGALILWFGWFGFNGGSTLAFSTQVPTILVNTLLAGSAGLTVPLLWQLTCQQTVTVDWVINGALAGLVAITANCHAVSSLSALVIGAIGGLVMILVATLLRTYHIDDAVGAISVHLGGGIWGTLAVALFADLDALGTDLSRLEQFTVQCSGILACGLWTFTITVGLLLMFKPIVPLRVQRKQEYLGLNITEHGAKTELHDLYLTMKTHVKTGNLKRRVTADPFSDVGQISHWYNQVVQALERVIAKLDAIVMTAADGILTIDPNTLTVKSTNPATETLFGQPWQQIMGQSLMDLIDINDCTLRDNGSLRRGLELKQFLQQGCHTGQVLDAIGIHRGGTRFPLEIIATASHLGIEQFWTVMARDVSVRKKTEAALQTSELEARRSAKQLQSALTKLKQAQAQLLHSEKMNGLGQVVAGIAHEINNPVSFIHGNLKYSCDYVQDLLQVLDHYQAHSTDLPVEVQMEIDELDVDFLKRDFPQMIQSMQHGTRRIQSIVQSLRNFSRFDEAEYKVVDIHEGLDSALMVLSPQLSKTQHRSKIYVQKEYGELPNISCYPGALNQVFLNILSNAIEAVEKRQNLAVPGKIVIQTSNDPTGNHITVSIIDNGDGIPEQMNQKIFDPFFTTKDVGKGTGMGLAISHQIIVEQHQGKLFCQSSPGHGATFLIQLPVMMKMIYDEGSARK